MSFAHELDLGRGMTATPPHRHHEDSDLVNSQAVVAPAARSLEDRIMLPESEATLSVLTEPMTDGSRLLVIDGATSLIVGLPTIGTVTIGRAPECEVRLVDAACSRRHAQLHIDDGALTLEDLGSHNGTRVNGERVAGRQLLTSDDVVSIGPIKLVIHAQPRTKRAVLLEPSALRSRLAQEAERSI